ncbi:MAG: alcohol dehydrogenase catalytic domain-containing protein [SAR202 cluster bacterium]|nr:alcohol dehydrogenase catalytic domain-containing protein [SAR202 cluster bacterium]MDP6511871.1 alcohol dehydrogenase catalytic domain-containing protein [SAR202 cluster bacterium]
MKALYVITPGDDPELEVREIETPTPGPGEVLVKIASAGVCSHDVAIMRGLLRRGVNLDVILGHEISGVVETIGPDVEGLTVGDAVVSTLTVFCGECDRCLAGHEYRCRTGQGLGHAVNGGFAEYIVLPERCLIPLPNGVSVEQASIVACPMGVALQALKDVARVREGETVLVTGAGGGLGIHAVQIASALGAHVMAATYSEDKLPLLDRFAPGQVILGGELDFSELALAFTEDQGANVVIDTVGSAVFFSALNSLAQFGRMVLLGEVEGGRVSFNLSEVIFRDASIRGSSGASKTHITQVLDLIGDGKLEPVISHRVPLADAKDAYHLIRDRESVGRVALIP